MSFSPQMKSETHGFTVVGDLKWRIWNDVVADLWDVTCAPEAHGVYLSPDPRLFVLLEIDGNGVFEMSQPGSGECVSHRSAHAMSFVPAGLVTEARCRGLTRIRHFDLHFSEAELTRRFGRDIDCAAVAEPRLDMRDARVSSLAAALAAECENPSPLHDLYGESLVNALLTALFEVRPRRPRRRTGLTRAQLNQVTAFMTERSFEPMRLADLAGLVGLSESHFSHAFKASTGVPPHRWQMQARIRRVQEMLSDGRSTLAEVAITAGFSDQAHLTRVFKAHTGVTPTEWRRRAAS